MNYTEIKTYYHQAIIAAHSTAIWFFKHCELLRSQKAIMKIIIAQQGDLEFDNTCI